MSNYFLSLPEVLLSSKDILSAKLPDCPLNKDAYCMWVVIDLLVFTLSKKANKHIHQKI